MKNLEKIAQERAGLAYGQKYVSQLPNTHSYLFGDHRFSKNIKVHLRVCVLLHQVS